VSVSAAGSSTLLRACPALALVDQFMELALVAFPQLARRLNSLFSHLQWGRTSCGHPGARNRAARLSSRN